MSQRANNIIIGILLVTAVILLISVGHYRGKLTDIQPKNDTVTTVRYDTVYSTNTVTVYEPKPYKVETVKVDTVYLKDSTKIELKEETKLYKDSTCQEGDTIFQELLIQGINAKVLYAKVLLKKQFIHQNTEKIITKYKVKKGFYIAPNASIGYGIFSRQPDIYLGIGIGYRF